MSWPLGSRFMVASALLAGLAFADASALGAPPKAPLGHPPKLSLFLEQFPLGVNVADFPLVTLQLEVEQRLRDLGVPLVARAAKPEPPYLHISIAVIRQTVGFVVLVQADLKELIPSACSGGVPLEVSTWQHRQWATIANPETVSAPEIRRFADGAIQAFVRAYGSHE